MTLHKVPPKHNPFSSLLYHRADISIGEETGGDTRNISLQLRTANGTKAGRTHIRAYLSDDAEGSTLTGTSPSGGIAIGDNGLLIEEVSGKVFTLVTDGNGLAEINIIEATGKSFYLVFLLPDGGLQVSEEIEFAA